MSYCRFGEGDVYMFRDATLPVIICQGCLFRDHPSGLRVGDTGMLTRTEAIDHLLKHREAGHAVPEHAIERLRRETAEVGDELL